MSKNSTKHSGLNVGYITVMLLFAVLCLTVFAVLSYRAAIANDVLNERTGVYLNEYYSADLKAKEILAQLDGIAESSRNSLLFADSFEEQSARIDGVSVKSQNGGCTAEYSVKINERQTLFASVTFFENRREYTINLWQSKTLPSEDESGLNVWDGTF